MHEKGLTGNTFDFGSGSGWVMVKSPGFGLDSGWALNSVVNQDSWRVYLTLLSHLVRIVFPVSAVSSKSERVFSTAGNVVSESISQSGEGGRLGDCQMRFVAA